MANSSAITDHKKTIQLLLCTEHASGGQSTYLSAINIFVSITAILGNTLILVALHKESSLHPPSKLLYRCLATTDLLVGLILEPSLAAHYVLLATEQRSSNLCVHFATIAAVSFTTLSAVSLLTMTTISVDRLLALLLGLRYRHIVTLRRVRALITSFWIFSLGFAVMTIWEFTFAKIYSYALMFICILVSLFSLLLFENFIHASAKSNSATAWAAQRWRDSLQYCKIQKNSGYCNLGRSCFNRLLFAIQYSHSYNYYSWIISIS